MQYFKKLNDKMRQTHYSMHFFFINNYIMRYPLINQR